MFLPNCSLPDNRAQKSATSETTAQQLALCNSFCINRVRQQYLTSNNYKECIMKVIGLLQHNTTGLLRRLCLKWYSKTGKLSLPCSGHICSTWYCLHTWLHYGFWSQEVEASYCVLWGGNDHTLMTSDLVLWLNVEGYTFLTYPVTGISWIPCLVASHPVLPLVRSRNNN